MNLRFLRTVKLIYKDLYGKCFTMRYEGEKQHKILTPGVTYNETALKMDWNFWNLYILILFHYPDQIFHKNITDDTNIMDAGSNSIDKKQNKDISFTDYEIFNRRNSRHSYRQI